MRPSIAFPMHSRLIHRLCSIGMNRMRMGSHAGVHRLAAIVVNLFGRIHLPVGFGQKLLGIHSIERVEGRSEAQGQDVFTAYSAARLLRQGVQEHGSLAD